MLTFRPHDDRPAGAGRATAPGDPEAPEEGGDVGGRHRRAFPGHTPGHLAAPDGPAQRRLDRREARRDAPPVPDPSRGARWPPRIPGGFLGPWTLPFEARLGERRTFRQAPLKKPQPIRREVMIDAPPDVVFSFFTDPAKFILWLGRVAELDARPGGLFRVNVNGRDVVRGTFLEVVPPRRVVFTWGWEGKESAVPPGSTRVEITLAPEGAGGTRLRLTHTGLPEPSRGGHDEGWVHYLARLGVAAPGGDPGPDPLGTLET